jgi:putative transposase
MSQWRQSLDQHPHLWDFEQWPFIEADTLPQSIRKPFITNRKIVAVVLSRTSLKSVAQMFNRSPASITQLMNRCFEPLNGDYALTQALIPYQRIKPYTRSSVLPTLTTLNPNAGASGGLGMLWVDYPGVKARLDHLLIQRIKEDPRAGPLSSAGFHGHFKALLAEYNYPTNQWPYTSQDQGRETLRRYLHRRWEELDFEHRQKRQTAIDIHRSQCIQHTDRLFGRIEIDAQQVDFRGRLNIVFNDQLIPLSLARAWLYCAIDVSTDCILGYILINKQKPSRWDVLRLFARCIRPWKPKEFTTPEFAYEPGACFPSALPACYSMTFHQIALDNDWAHHAAAVEQFLVPKLGATIQFGYAREPRQRKWIEHAFDTLNRRLSHRTPSTTGSSILDPKREPRKNQKQPPMFTYVMFLEALELVLSQHNLRKQAGRLAGASPIELVIDKAERHWTPYVPEHLRGRLQPMEIKKRVPIKSRTDGYALHINYEDVAYPCSTLAQLTVNDAYLDIVVNTDDVRVITAYNVSGKKLGDLYAPRSWQSYPHSLDTRILIQKLVRKDRLNSPDLLAGALLRLLETPKNQKSVQHALRLYSEYTGFDVGVTSILPLTLWQKCEENNSNEPSTHASVRHWRSMEASHASRSRN